MTDNIRYYANHAQQFCESTLTADMSDHYRRFLSHLRLGCHILDAGCGSGRDARYFLEQGFRVTAFDACQELCNHASALLGQPVACLRFEDMAWDRNFDGIWACASLLHVKPEDLPGVFDRLFRALRPEGILYASFKYGDGLTRRGERSFTDFTEAGIRELLQQTGRFRLLECFVTEDVRPDHAGERWTNLLARRI